MLRPLVLSLLAVVSACAQAPVAMPATRASELLERFAAGGAAATDVCTPAGRAQLRGAVRAYSAAMTANGVVWPATQHGQINGVDASVMVAFTAGFIEASDLHGPARAALGQLALANWPEVRGMRSAMRTACSEVVALHHAAARVVMETERLQQMASASADRLHRQHLRVERAHIHMQQQAALVSARVEAARAG